MRTNVRANERKVDNQISSLTTNVNMDNRLHEILTFCALIKLVRGSQRTKLWKKEFVSQNESKNKRSRFKVFHFFSAFMTVKVQYYSVQEYIQLVDTFRHNQLVSCCWCFDSFFSFYFHESSEDFYLISNPAFVFALWCYEKKRQ